MLQQLLTLLQQPQDTAAGDAGDGAIGMHPVLAAILNERPGFAQRPGFGITFLGPLLNMLFRRLGPRGSLLNSALTSQEPANALPVERTPLGVGDSLNSALVTSPTRPSTVADTLAPNAGGPTKIPAFGSTVAPQASTLARPSAVAQGLAKTPNPLLRAAATQRDVFGRLFGK